MIALIVGKTDDRESDLSTMSEQNVVTTELKF